MSTQLVKALLKSVNGSSETTEMTVQFNPKELSVDKKVSWTNAQGPASEDPVQEFKEPQSRTLTATLYFDTYEKKLDVYDEYVKKLEKLVTIEGTLGRPPLVIFQWNKFTFKGVVESLTQKYTMFLADGTRCRCEVSFSMKSASDAKVATKATGSTGGAPPH